MKERQEFSSAPGKIRPLIRAFLAILPDMAVLMLYLAVKLRIVTLAAK